MKRKKSPVLLACLLTAAAILNMSQGETDMKLDNRLIREANPRNYSIELAQENRLSNGDEFTDEYFLLKAYFGKCLFAWLDSQIRLSEADLALSGQERFIPVNGDSMTIYQAGQAYGMQFFCIRSNLCIERLDEDSLAVLREAIANGTNVNDPEIRTLIEDTWTQVICLDPEKPMDSMYILDPNEGIIVRNDCLLIGLATRPEYDEDGMMINPEQEAEKESFLQAAIPQMEVMFSETLGSEVRIIRLR